MDTTTTTTTTWAVRTWDEDVGHILRRARKARRWSLRTAATKTGVSASHLARLETACRAPSRAVADRLATVYELPPGPAARLRSASLAGVGRDRSGKRSWG